MTFAEKVYDVVRKVPKGKVTTYKAIAKALNTKAYRAVGQALRCNPYAPEVPCHRVICSDGSIGGFEGKKKGKEIQKKINLLQDEGMAIINNKIDKRYFFKPPASP
ncbi:MGMT family protein [Candidatus Woesearchaeota archaeon]|nr:MGMT family protein [Candidatus Woesearchaeota archaeon]